MFFSIIGGLGLFLLGMGFLSEGLQNVAGNGLRRLVAIVTGNRFMAVGIGALVTTIIQSSSITTVMVVGFVNSGFMTLAQAIGVIMGANIGTTITGWLLVLRIGAAGLPMLGIAALFYRFSRKEWIRFVALAIMGLGMVFFGLELMKNGFAPIRDMPFFMELFALFTTDSYGGVIMCALMGCILTILVQSSSATLGITIGLASTGVIGFETAAALVLGENIGTTATAMVASAGANTNARRAAWAHFIFNVTGVFWITLLFRPYIEIIKAVTPTGAAFDFTASIAAVHTGFNVMNTLLFMPLIPVLDRLLHRLVPDKVLKEPPHLTHLDVRLIETPVIGLEQARVEVLLMGDMVSKMMTRLAGIISGDIEEEEQIRKVFHAEEVLDVIQKEIVQFLTDILALKLAPESALESRKLLHIADEYESVSDYAANLLKFLLKLQNEQDNLSEEGRKALIELIGDTIDYLQFINRAFHGRHVEVLRDSKTWMDSLMFKVKKARKNHMSLISEGAATPLNSVVFTEMLNSFRRINDHLYNIAEALEER